MKRAAAALAALIALSAAPGCASLVNAAITPQFDATAASLPAGDYTLDTSHAALIFKVSHLGFADYVGRFERFEASLSGDPATPDAASLTAIIDMTSLDVANPDFAQTLMGPDWFNAGAYPQAVFRSAGITVTDGNTATVNGALTLNGITQPITLAARLNGSGFDRLRGADVVGFSAEGEINRSDFGIDRFSGPVGETVRIEIEAEFVKN